MSDVHALVLTGYGLNCDHETAYALELAGASATRVHINSLIDGSVKLKDFQMMVFGGGFSWGDDHGGGVIQAVRLKTNIGDNILEFIEKGNLVLGICNGFQTLVNLGLLPGFDGDYKTRSVALTYNDCGNFRDDWVNLKVNAASPCVFTRGLDQMELPIRHGEGKFYSDESTIKRLFDNKQVVLQYATRDGELADCRRPFNPNGSISDIAGICDTTGRIFGLMPHPEAFSHWTSHPDWTRIKEEMKRQGGSGDSGVTVGIRLFQNAVKFF
ncbi:phosphoribosylformylglycinamidine synthase I [Desulfonema magnum]|uniref:Phosphoribosylformylglycinamidine synthase subunit n=1 Tax=Desulfonema magnum TaxID=45655 RepID=A0A975BQK3_9BACT|nr:phosphoribosylformylglycinamidine synthase I [Desulfonema magnum]QTA89379.1 Phosphoribosylformylglycinamidine synthase subunit [Desulfonema magnum]